jgi:hypothetical protein
MLQARSDRSTTRGCCPHTTPRYVLYQYESTNTDAEGAAGKKRPYDDARLLPSHNITKRQRAWQEQVADAASFASVFVLLYQ